MKHRRSYAGRRIVVVLTAAGVLAAGRPCGAQSDTARPATPSRVRHSDPRIAFLLGVVSPGLGHDYTRDHTRAFAIRAGVGGTLVGALAFWSKSLDAGSECGRSDASCWETALRRSRRYDHGAAACVVTGAAVWAYGIVDAPLSARRANAAHRASRIGLLAPYVDRAPAGGFGVGASIAFR